MTGKINLICCFYSLHVVIVNVFFKCLVYECGDTNVHGIAAKGLYEQGMLKLNGTMRADKGTAYRLLMRAAELGSQDAKVTYNSLAV